MTEDRSNGVEAAALNAALIEALKEQGHICTPRVEAAFRAVERHRFLPGRPLEEVYADRVIVTKQDETGQPISSSSQPAMMAIMLEQLDLKPGQAVLEIGAGTGYNAALMAEIVGERGGVVAVEIDLDLAEAARAHLAAAGFERVQVVCADGGYGYPDAAPYDRIILTVGADDITPGWMQQLKPGGLLLLPLRIYDVQHSIAFEKVGDHLVSRSVANCGFMMLRGAFAALPVETISLGPEPGLVLEGGAVDAGQIYAWLTGPAFDRDTGLEVILEEVMTGLALWLALHGLPARGLTAQGEMVERNIVPPLAHWGGNEPSVSTGLLVEPGGMAALTCPPGQLPPLIDFNKPGCLSQSFRLYIRGFGPDEAAAQRLLGATLAWDAAGRPAAEGLRVRAYPKETEFRPGENEFLVERQWMRLMLDWPTNT